MMTINCGGEQASKESGKMRVEGKTYIVNDSDIITYFLMYDTPFFFLLIKYFF